MDIILLPRPIKKSIDKQEATRQLWFENEEGMYKVYKKTEHTLQLSGPANKPFICQFILVVGTLSLDYTSVRTATELVSQNEMRNAKFMDSNEITENFVFGNDSKYYLKICGSCARKPAKLCIRLHCDGLLFEKYIQFVSDSLVKSLRKNGINPSSTSINKRTSEIPVPIHVKRYKQNKDSYEISLDDIPSEPQVDLILRSMQPGESPVFTDFTRKGVNGITVPSQHSNAVASAGGAGVDVISQPNLFNPIFFQHYEHSITLRKHNIQTLQGKLPALKTLIIQIQNIFGDAEEFFNKLQIIEFKLHEMYQLIETLEHEQPEPSLPFLVDRQDRLLKLSDNLFTVQEELSTIDKYLSTLATTLMPIESQDTSPTTLQLDSVLPVLIQQQQNVDVYVNNSPYYYNGYAPN